MSFNCNNIHHLGFDNVRTELKPSVFSQLLQQCPNIDSLRLHSQTLHNITSSFTDEKISSLLNKMIKHIQFNDGLEGEDLNEQSTRKFVQTFTNLQRIYLHIKSQEDILNKLPIMIRGMKRLNKILIKPARNLSNGFIDQIRESIVELKESYIRKEKSCLFIWR